MNPKAIFLQTLIGLIAYAYGLKDMGFSLLNMLGCCCSIDQVRNHGSFWAKKRTASYELLRDNVALWRVSFDNLNYRIKYAKKLTTSGPKKMLNLITSQVCFRDIKSCALPLKSLSTMCTNQLYQLIYLHSKPIDPTMFTVDVQSVFFLY